MTVATAPAEVVEDAAGGGDLLGDAVDAQRQLGDHRERALRAEQQPREVVAGRGLAGARAGVDHRAVGEHRAQAEHVLAHRAVAGRAGARGGGGRHAAERGVGAGVDGEEQPVLPEPLLERQPVHARLHAAVEVLGVDLEHAVHAGEVEREPAVDGQHVALERAAGAPRDHRHAVLGAGAQDRGDLLGGVRERDGVGLARGEAGLVARVQAEDRGRGGEALAEQVAQRAGGRLVHRAAASSSATTPGRSSARGGRRRRSAGAARRAGGCSRAPAACPGCRPRAGRARRSGGRSSSSDRRCR